jgi:amino acid transporter
VVPAAQVLIAVLPLVAVGLLAVLSFFFFLWDHKRKRLMIDKGQTPVPRNIDDKLLLLGIVSLFVGVGLLIFFALYNGLSNTLLGGIIPVTAGLGIITHYIIMHGRRNGQRGAG